MEFEKMENLKALINFNFEDRISISRFTDKELLHIYNCIETELYCRNFNFLNSIQRIAYKKVFNVIRKYYLTDGEAKKERSDAGSP